MTASEPMAQAFEWRASIWRSTRLASWFTPGLQVTPPTMKTVVRWELEARGVHNLQHAGPTESRDGHVGENPPRWICRQCRTGEEPRRRLDPGARLDAGFCGAGKDNRHALAALSILVAQSADPAALLNVSAGIWRISTSGRKRVGCFDSDRRSRATTGPLSMTGATPSRRTGLTPAWKLPAPAWSRRRAPARCSWSSCCG